GLPFAPLRAAASMLGAGVRMFLLEWSRAAEITCDRAGAICAGGVRPMITALGKLKTRGQPALADFNVDAYIQQLDAVRSTPLKLVEFLQTHPMTQKRMAALQVFSDSEIYRAWLPAVSADCEPRSRADVDRACEDIVRIGV